MPENRLSRPTPLHPTPCAPPRPTPPWGCPTPPRTPLSPWVPLGAPRGGAAGGKSWPKVLAQNSAQWAKCSTGSGPFPHKMRGAPRAADPHPHRSTFRAYSRRDPLGAGQSWHSTGYWVERSERLRLWNLNLKAEARGRESRGSMGSRGLRPCDSESQAHHAPAIEIGGGESKGRAPTRANKGPAKGHTNA